MSFTADFVPKKESDLVDFLQNFGTRAAAEAAAIGLTPAQCTAFNALVASFVASWEITRYRSTRSGASVIVKDERKKLVVKSLRELAGVAQKHPGTTNEQRSLLGLTVPAVRQKRPVPAEAPVVENRGVTGNVLRIRLHGVDSTRRGKPANCSTAQIYAYVGATEPTDPNDWLFQGATSSVAALDVVFAADLPMGTKAWVCAAWANEKGQAGPASPAMGVTLLGSAALPTAAQSGGGLSLAA